MSQWHNEHTDRLVKVITDIDSEQECYELLEDLCTIKEIIDMSQRLEVARLLSQGKNYQEITALTEVSTATISRVKKCLDYGDGGYRKAIEKIEKDK